MASRKAVATIAKLLEQTTTKAVPVENFDTWMRVLDPLDDDLAIAAAMRVVRHTTKPFPVPPGAIWVAAEEILSEQFPSDGEAWRLAVEAAKVNPAERDKLPRPVEAAAEQVGWWMLRDTTSPETTRAHYMQFYREALRRGIGAMALGRGAFDMLGRANG